VDSGFSRFLFSTHGLYGLVKDIIMNKCFVYTNLFSLLNFIFFHYCFFNRFLAHLTKGQVSSFYHLESSVDPRRRGIVMVSVCPWHSVCNSSATVGRSVFIFGRIVSHDMWLSLLQHYFDSTKFVGVEGLTIL